MISYSNIKAKNLYTEGFEASESAPMTLTFSSGSFNLIKNKREETITKTVDEAGKIVEESSFELVEELESYSYQGFEFPVESDEEFPVVYDIFLLESDNRIHIDRTELGSDTICVYTGEESLAHTLCSFTLPPSTSSLEHVQIEVRNILKEQEA